MFDLDNAIREINMTCKFFFQESTFFFNLKGNKFIITGNNVSKAINHNKNDLEEVNVIKWFDNFWVYAEIKAERSETGEQNIFISLSVFQGDDTDEVKYQLFRAEWDNFQDNDTHPQPHWHIYSNQQLEKTVTMFADLIEDEKEDFMGLINEEKEKGIDLRKIHFAMKGLWDSEGGGHIHQIREGRAIVNWFQGLLGHIKSQLEFVR